MCADTITTNYHWVKPEPHFSPLDWGIKWNADLDLIDAQVFQTASAVGTLNGTSGKPTTLIVDKAAVADGAPITGKLNGVNRWVVQLGGPSAEGTGTAGSDFTVSRYNNAGTFIDTPLTIARANGQATFLQTLNATGLINANGGVTAKTTMSTVAVGAGHSYLGFFDATPTRIGYVGWLNGGTSVNLTRDGGASVNVGTTIGLNGAVIGTSTASFTGVTLTQGFARVQRGATTQALVMLNDNTLDRGAVSYNASTAQTALQSITSPGITGSSLVLDAAANFTFNGSGVASKAGGGSWAAISDERLKDVVNAYDAGLNEIIRLRPVTYRYKTDSPARFARVGLVAQQAELVMPELVSIGPGEIDGEKVDDLRTLDPSAIVFALINAVKDLKREVDELRAKLP